MTEEFVSFSLAKKLKEKGFNVPCIYAYCEKGGWNSYTQKHEPLTYILRTDSNPFGAYYTGDNWNKEYKTNKNKIQCSAPTISQVLKWLREEKIFISIGLSMCGYHYDVQYNIKNNSDYPDLLKWDNAILNGEQTIFASYEEAAIAGIEYCLHNVI